MMRFLLSTAAAALISSAAHAADFLPFEEPGPSLAPIAAGDWGGFYVGLHGGYGWSDVEACLDGGFDSGDADDDDERCIGLNDAFGVDIEGPVFGGQVGVNWQWNSIVLGAEGDASWSGIEASFDDGTDDEDAKLYDYLASARLRAGFTVDRFLVFGTGGVGFARIDMTGGEGDSEIEIGWAAGGGGEFLVTNNVTVGAEYLHYDFEDVLDTEDAELNTDADVVRGRVNLKFGNLFGGG
ncbi:MAG: porin family protein [Rhizobiales bacterium]|nr:porin family protein [Hyphomicrobiales bacterium]